MDNSEIMRADLGIRATWLVLNHHCWVKRRVESVQFYPDGDTRRKVSFDFAIPPEYVLLGSEIGASEDCASLAAVPVAFMRKGSFVGLEIKDSVGASVPSAGFIENGRITFQALKTLAYRVYETNPDCPDLPLHLDDALKAVIYSRSSGTASNTGTDENRFSAFKDLLERELSEDSQRKEPTDDDDHVSDLMHWLSQVISLKDTSQELSTSLLMLLATVSKAYAFTVLLPVDQVSSRTILKLSFDTDIEPAVEANVLTRIRSWWSVGGAHTLAFATRSAASTHIELSPTAGTEIVLFQVNSNDASSQDVPKSAIRARTVGRHAHITISPKNNVPLTHIDIKLWPRKSEIKTLVFWSAGSACLNLLCLTLLITKTDVLAKFATADNILATITILFAVWVAVAITSNRHYLENELTRQLNTATNRTLMAMTTSLFFLAVSTTPSGLFEVGSHIVSGKTAFAGQYSLVNCVGIVVTMLCLVISVHDFTQSSHALYQFYQDQEDATRLGFKSSGVSFLLESNVFELEKNASKSINQTIDPAEMAGFECVSGFERLKKDRAFQLLDSASVELIGGKDR